MAFHLSINGPELKIEGDVDIQTIDVVTTAVRTAVHEHGEIVFDLAKTDYINSVGVQMFATAMQCVKAQGGLPLEKVTLRNIPNKVRQTLDLSGLSKMMRWEGEAPQ